jgi:energy-coupling factor transport system permease protein
MKNLEFFARVSIGQYLERDSVVHRLSPAAKYLWLLAMVIPLGFLRSPLLVAFIALSALALALLARISPLYLLKGFLPVLPLVLIAGGMQVLFGWSGDTSPVIVKIGRVSLTLREAGLVAAMAMRFLAMMLAIGLFTSVISEGDTARGIEDVLAPFGRLGFPVHELALTVAVAFRFIPIVVGELETVVKAQAARGADFGRHRGGPIRKARAYLPLLVPVTIRALERAEALADAMETRCYTSKGRTRYVEPPSGPGDSVARFMAVGYFLLVVAAEFSGLLRI